MLLSVLLLVLLFELELPRCLVSRSAAASLALCEGELVRRGSVRRIAGGLLELDDPNAPDDADAV